MPCAGQIDCHIPNPTAKHIRESTEVKSSAEYLMQYLAAISKVPEHGD